MALKSSARLLGTGLVAVVIAAAAPPEAIESRRPLSAAQNLRVSENAATLTVSGETFAYRFSRANGLITSIAVLGQEVTTGAAIPDLVLAEQINRDFMPYAARHETNARVSLISSAPSRIVLRSEGSYAREDGSRFPLSYAITYGISTDGVVLVNVENTASENCTFRWLTLSGGAIRDSLAKFISWMPEQAISQSSRFQFRPVPPAPENKILAGTFLPWFWIGDERVGLEVTTWEVNSQTYNQVDGTSRRDQNEMFAVRRAGDRIEWENFLVRNSTVYARAGWRRSGQFALGVTPSKKFDPYFAMLKGAHMGPHQHRPQIVVPSEEQIRTLARNGFNLVVGMANWRSGEYIPLNEEDLRRTIALCHQYGIKIIPYMTLVDLSLDTETFRRHGEEWAIEPTTEHFRMTSKFRDPDVELAYRSDPDHETMLMCPGAPGWREFWKKQIDRVIDRYDFDGLYFDFWFGRMVCENARHGCGGRFRKFTVLEHRDMLVHAYNRLKAKNPGAIIKANTNLLSTALITSLIDLRLVGESIDVTTMDPFTRQWLYSSYRLGQPSEFLWAGSRWDEKRRAWFAALVNFLPQYYFRPRLEPRLSYDDFDVFRYFGAAAGEWTLGIQSESRGGVSVNTVRKEDGSLLLTFINTGESPVLADAPVATGRIAYEPLAGRLGELKDGKLQAGLAAYEYRTFVVAAHQDRPRLLFALGADRPLSEEWDQRRGRLTFSVAAPPGARVRFTIHAPRAVRAINDRAGKPVIFTWSVGTGLAEFEADCEPGDTFEAHF